MTDTAKFRNLVHAEDEFLARREVLNYQALGAAIAAALQTART